MKKFSTLILSALALLTYTNAIAIHPAPLTQPTAHDSREIGGKSRGNLMLYKAAGGNVSRENIDVTEALPVRDSRKTQPCHVDVWLKPFNEVLLASEKPTLGWNASDPQDGVFLPPATAVKETLPQSLKSLLSAHSQNTREAHKPLIRTVLDTCLRQNVDRLVITIDIDPKTQNKTSWRSWALTPRLEALRQVLKENSPWGTPYGNIIGEVLFATTSAVDQSLASKAFASMLPEGYLGHCTAIKDAATALHQKSAKEGFFHFSEDEVNAISSIQQTLRHPSIVLERNYLGYYYADLAPPLNWYCVDESLQQSVDGFFYALVCCQEADEERPGQFKQHIMGVKYVVDAFDLAHPIAASTDMPAGIGAQAWGSLPNFSSTASSIAGPTDNSPTSSADEEMPWQHSTRITDAVLEGHAADILAGAGNFTGFSKSRKLDQTLYSKIQQDGSGQPVSYTFLKSYDIDPTAQRKGHLFFKPVDDGRLLVLVSLIHNGKEKLFAINVKPHA